MKKKQLLKKIFVCVLLLTITTIPVNAAELIGSGTEEGCFSFQYDSNGCLTISGKGEMEDFVIDFDRKVRSSHSYRMRVPNWNEYRDKVKRIVVEEGITSIGSGAFFDFKNVKSVSLPQSLTQINAMAFEGCENLVNINFPAKLEKIGMGAFEECKNLEKALFSGKLTTLEDDAFDNCSNLKEVTLLDGLLSVGKGAFGNCYNLKKIQFPNSLIDIGEYAFENCDSLTEVILPEKLLYIGDSAFKNCGNLKNINIPRELIYIGDDAFDNCNCLSETLVKGGIRAKLPMESTNINKNNYDGNFAQNTKSCLYSDEDEYIRVEQTGSIITVEKYSLDFKLISSKNINTDLASIYGGCYHGKKYNFIVIGWENVLERDSQEVIRIIKYDTEWNEIDYACLYGANTVEPFRGGTLDFAESNDTLYIHTCHKMYKSSDGRNHQANMSFSINQNTMEISDAQYNVAHSYGYVSHSFNQRILIDNDQNILTLDHGDGYPRSIVLQKYLSKAYRGQISGSTNEVEIQSYPGDIGENYTGASVGGIVETIDNYATVYNYIGEGVDVNDNNVRNIYVSFTDKKNFCEQGTKRIQITSYPNNGTYKIGNPMIVPLGLDKGYILWSEKQLNSDEEEFEDTGKVSYVTYSADGTISPIKTVDAQLSDCQPLVDNGKLVWYVTDHSAPTFYELDENGIRSHRIGSYLNLTDVDISEYYLKPIGWAMGQGITYGTSDTTFSPSDTCTRGQAVTFLWRAAGSEKVTGIKNPFTDVSSSDYYYDAILWAYKNGITTGTSDTTFDPNGKCNRGQIVTFLWRTEHQPGANNTIRFNDVKQDAYYYNPVKWAVANGVTNGTTANTFSPDASCTRGQIVTFLYRAMA